jgi:transposase
LNSKLHAVCDGYGRPFVMLLSEGQMSDYKGAVLMLPAMPKAKQLLADKGYDADWFHAALAKRGVAACIPSKSNRKTAIPRDAILYKQRHKIENMFGLRIPTKPATHSNRKPATDSDLKPAGIPI